MRLIYIANARMPTEKAHGIQIMKMCEAFANSKLNKSIKLELVVPQRFNYIKDDPFEYYGVKRNFKITKLPCLDLVPLDKYIGHLGSWIESITFNFFVFPYILFKKADIIYTRDKLSLFLILFKKNLFFEAHTFPKNYFLYSLFFKRLKKIIVITQNLKGFFEEQGISSNKVSVVPDGVDLEKFNIKDSQEECRRKLNLPLDRKIVLYAGHLYEWKGAQVLADASQFLPEDMEIYFVGGTDKDVKKFKIQNSKFKINIVGHKPYSEIPFWLKAADVLVLPNSAKQDISKHWTSPLKLFEYMASKRPIIASNLPSIREILNENNSFLVEPDNPEKLAKGIENILKSPNLSAKISNQAFNDVLSYSWEKRAKNILQFLKYD
ncbi:MAG: glycosyltransferase [Patescibacteria group bacterium]|nr:glycosyltransferase [Patescibacteria group bacterium]